MNIPNLHEVRTSDLVFTKMHGLGNDFVMLDCIRFPAPSEAVLPDLAVKVCDRHFGVGGDGLILILEDDEADYRMRMFNPDGSEAEMCGNGIRCFGKYLFDAGLIEARAISVATMQGLQHIEIVPGQSPGDNPLQVRVDMGAPRLLRSQIPMTVAENQPDDRVIDEALEVNGNTYRITGVSMGNPHVVIFVDDVESVPLKEIGLEIEHDQAFPARTNVHFVQEMGRAKFWVRHWERGAGDTLACGTGACASIVAAILNGKLPAGERRALAHLPGGDLDIDWAHNGKVYMTGPAMTVMNGTLDAEFLADLA